MPALQCSTSRDITELLRSDIGPAALDETRADRQFPYRVEPNDPPDLAARVRDDIDVILAHIEQALWKQARVRVLSPPPGETLGDVVSRVRIHLWRRSLPRFDAWRGVPLFSFLWTCIANECHTQRRRAARLARQHTFMTVAPEVLDCLREVPDRKVDEARAIRFAERLINNPFDPAFGLTRGQARVIQTVLEADPGEPQSDIARRLGYERAGSFSQMLGRCRQRILEAFNNESEHDYTRPTASHPEGGSQ